MSHQARFRLIIIGAILLFPVVNHSCTTDQAPTDLSRAAIIPRPVSVEVTGKSFLLNEKTSIYVPPGSREAFSVGEYLASRLNPATGLNPEVLESSAGQRKGNIYLSLGSGQADLGFEGYELNITEKWVQVTANGPAGLFYGVQTLLQILPAGIEMTTLQEGPWSLPTGTIRDFPEYAYRGAMLDVARHFFKSGDVKQYIDLMARYKLNQLHLHLADDQGWRIEIKSWPNLAIHGGSTQVGGGRGGYYTQEEYAELVRYAQSRYISVIPEIDMPGHTNAALASYPELNCDGKATALYTGMEVGFSTLCISKEITYRFVTDVFTELAALTPGPFLHIGGDESHATRPEDYKPFIRRVQEIVASTGKIAMGWDDIASSELLPGTVCQHWATVPNAVKAADQGSKLVLSPARKAYLDMKYDSTTVLGLKWAGYIEVDSAYAWDPATLVPGIGRDDILGVEAPLWTETVTTLDEIEYLAFPRLPGYAEIGWTPASLRSWDDYKFRLAAHGQRLEALGVNFHRSVKVPWDQPLSE
jgi:hexosaminidase